MRKQDISEFIALTQCTKEIARKYLSRNNGALDYALNDYYDSETGSFVIKQKVYPSELIAVFENYRDRESDKILADGLITYIGDLGYQLEDITTLCLTDLLQCSSLEEGITRDQFLSNWLDHECKNLRHMKAMMDRMKDKLQDDAAYFNSIYISTFELTLEENQKQLDVDTAVSYWQLFFPDTKQYAIKVDKTRMDSWYRFVNTNTSKISKDVWQMFLMFITKFPDNESLRQNYNELDAWPLLIDEYYEYLEDIGQV
ncbi:LAFE_0H08042g1_1 [Lachancea fermentati]|uniref:Defective in cullin neddylation protein n=1 Tax=Lachancea fermentati TaxID=4955 RepID=A0A1G4MKC0_LACFM|nr:LAFE_0H08042g1_1 [Lachancea fermentati]